MKVSEYNPTARAAFGQSLVDIGVSVFRAIVMLLSVAPLTLALTWIFQHPGEDIGIVESWVSVSGEVYCVVLVFLFASFLIGHCFRAWGLEHIHKASEASTRSEHSGGVAQEPA